ncbi:nuclear transport factor 2 family protein [Rufibacter sp. XAAS-G3-1]|uniref:nuclear transport factor 2 family protein n=1 Tax=Rufibacter sp. XAAS-G3-1 TaxID=2729134 RepID=UPI0015E7A770|nr:nuclear transport factor 2 family protein [Rufibacter sp. XAAS-G3-1]
METRESIIQNYIHAYNAFDIERMLFDLDQDITFENISNGETNLSLNGLTAFRAQAEAAKDLFSERTQTIKSFTHHPDATEVAIAYKGILALDLPNGLKKGDTVQLAGKSVFRFSGDKIIQLTDIS